MSTNTQSRTKINRRAGEPGFHEVHKPEAGGIARLSDEDIRNYMNVAVKHAKRRFVQAGKPDPHAAQDVAQSAILEFLAQVEKRPALLDENPEGYITTTVRHMVSAETSEVSKSARSGWVQFNKIAEQERQRLGRSLTTAEEDKIGEQVLQNWVGDNKPPEKFWKKTRGITPADLSEWEHANLTPAFGDQSYGRAPDQFHTEMGDWSRTIAELHKDVNAVSLIKFNAFAEHYNITPVLLNSNTRRTELETRRAVEAFICERGGFDKFSEVTDEEASEGLSVILKDYLDGKDNPLIEDVFRPWNRETNRHRNRKGIPKSDLPAKERRAVAEALLKHPTQVYPLWKSALSLSDCTNYPRVLAVFDKAHPIAN